MKKIITLFAAFFLVFTGHSQTDAGKVQRWLQKNPQFVPEIKTMIQLWGLYSIGMEVYDADQKRYNKVENRFNLLLRRARFSVGGEPYAGLKYSVVFFYDQTGRDILASGVGGPNKADPAVGVWDAFLQWQIAGNEALNLTGGWFRPQIQRESITSAWATNSFEKAMSQAYVRTHLTGTGPGRAMGLNLGGIFTGEKISLNYNVGIFNPVSASLNGASAGEKFSLLLAGRLSLWLGDPELTKYGISYDINYFNKRKGVSIDLNVSRQGESDIFRSSTLVGPGILLNWGPLNLDGEWLRISRRGEIEEPGGQISTFIATAGTGHLRAGINLPTGRFILEPTIMVMHFSGEMNTQAQEEAGLVNMPYGEESTYDAGLNWYLDGKNLKLMLHYTWRSGNAGEAGEGAQANMFFSQNGIGAIRRGDWAGLGLSAVF